MRSVRILAALFLAFIPLLWAQPAWASTVSGYVYENGSITIYAPEGSTFDGVVLAFYGDPADPTRGADVSQIVASLAVGQSVVTIDANNGVFGDPVYGTYKIFMVTLSFTDPVIIDPTPEPTPTVEPTVEPTPDPTPTVDPTPQPTVDPTPTPTPKPKPSPTFIGPPVPVPTDTPSPTPTIEPTVDPTPEPTPTEEPVVPSPEPSATISPSEEPAPAPETTTEPTPIPTEDVTNPLPNPEPSSTPEPSAAHEAAIQRLAEEAKADDQELDPQIAAIPVLGNVAAAVLDTFNELGNVGADMTPETRETAEKTVIAAVIVTQAAVSAVTTAAVSASAASASYRKKD